MIKNYLLLAVSAVLLAGCLFQFAYNHLDWIIPWHVGKMISLNSEQETELEQKLMAQLKWHRATQLSEYAKSIEELGAAVKTDLTMDHINQFHLTMRKYWQDIVNHVCPDMAHILSSATEEQVEELIYNLHEKSRKYRKELVDLTEKEFREKKSKRMIRFLEFCMGDLTEKQEKIVKKWSYDLKKIGHARLAYFQLRQIQFEEIIKQRNDFELFEKQLCELLYFNPESWPKEYQKITAYNQNLTKHAFINIQKCMTQDQKDEFIENIESIINDFRKFSKTQYE